MCNVFCPFSAVEYHYNRAMIKRSLQIASFHLTRLFELRKSCWEIRDSQRVWKPQVLDVFLRNSLVLAKQSVGCDKTTRCSRSFKGHFSDFFRRNLFFFPWNFENVRGKFKNIGENQRKVMKESANHQRIEFGLRQESFVILLDCSKFWPNFAHRFNTIRSVFS